MTLRSLVIALVLLFVILQYNLWIASSGIASTIHFHHMINVQLQANEKLQERNQGLQAQVDELQEGKATVVDLARTEIGMVKPDETYYQFVK